MREKYPSLQSSRMVAAIDPYYNNSVQMLLAPQCCNSNGLYDYATISYDDLCNSSSNYYHQPQQNQYYFNCMTPVTFVPNPNLSSTTIRPELGKLHFRPPPNFPPPPPPPSPPPKPASTSLLATRHSTTPISAASIVRVSDDSAYSDSSASTLQCRGEVTANRSGMLLRMDLSKNPPVFVQGL
ncbi:unnamed protein product [Cercopithifilaria johnstoni]|uniref:Uncharacterized protein n=1 Tax=Cercopithifilaria johnstoni TaxID=2874296 RepID=A0A8J2MQE3_9BILA|nr:unnamed protein product [Cercopithifilaria johnstoni]